MYEYIRMFFDWLKNQSSGIAVTVIGGLIVNLAWGKYKSWKDSEEVFNYISQEAINNLNYNAQPGVGGPEVNFQTDGLQKLLVLKKLNSELQKEVEEYIHDARICNGRGGYSKPGRKPGHIQQKSKELMKKLQDKNNY